MPLLFSEVSTLLSRLEEIELHEPPILDPKSRSKQIENIVKSWFSTHRTALRALDIEHAVAFISTLLPERRTDRVYGMQAPRLCRILGRALGLASSSLNDLQVYNQRGCGDLATRVALVIQKGGAPARPAVTVDEVDDMLHTLAAHCRFSGPGVAKPSSRSWKTQDSLLGDVFKRLYPEEAKWLIRLILKDFSPLQVDEELVLESFHFLLPDLLLFQNDLGAVIKLLKIDLKAFPDTCDRRSMALHREMARGMLRPMVGIKVGRPSWNKGRGIDHCLRMTAGQSWVLERKYDGEYCEIHVDLTKSSKAVECIKIFSKSGKDSTADRSGLHQTLVNCLRLRQPGCLINKQAILLGEMVVYSDSEEGVLPFEEVRKHVTRSGSFIGTDYDSPPKSDEHLAIVFYDLLLWDNEVVMNKPIKERRTWLREIYAKMPGRAMGAEWKIIDFANGQRARKLLVDQFAASNAQGCEGLILKPCGVPYFDLDPDGQSRAPKFIKLKKDYIEGMGDEADFAVIGASYNAQLAAKCGLSRIQWTDFHIGCLINKDDVKRFDARPRFKLVGTIQQDQCIPKPILQAANDLGKFIATLYNPNDLPFDLEIAPSTRRLDVLFPKPLVLEVLGSGFEKPSNADFYMLRHPRVKKLHQDRSWKDCVSFQELQKRAKVARDAPPDSESQKTRRWIERLERKCRIKFERERSGTPSTARSARTKSSKGSGAGVEGTTLVGTSPKRKWSTVAERETPCPESKRQRLHDAPRHCKKTIPPRSSPLAGVTNTASALVSVRSPRKAPTASTSTSNKSQLQTLPTPPSSSTAKPPNPDPKRNFSEPIALHISPTIPTQGHTTILSHLSSHPNITLVRHISHWDRACLPPRTPPFCNERSSEEEGVLGSDFPPEVVQESQADEGVRKVVLVDLAMDGNAIAEAGVDGRAGVGKIVTELRVVKERGCFGGVGVEVWGWREFVECLGVGGTGMAALVV